MKLSHTVVCILHYINNTAYSVRQNVHSILFSPDTPCFEQADHYQVFILYKNLKPEGKSVDFCEGDDVSSNCVASSCETTNTAEVARGHILL